MATDLMQAAAAYVAAQTKGHASQTVTYTVKSGTHAGEVLTGLQAGLGMSLLRLSSEFDLRVEHTDADFNFTAADLAFGGVGYIPQRGDRIQVTLFGTLRIFEVHGFGGEPPFRWLDPYQTMIQARTKYVGAA